MKVRLRGRKMPSRKNVDLFDIKREVRSGQSVMKFKPSAQCVGRLSQI